jgi:hypothetical protein
VHERADSTISLAISFVIYLALAICGFSPFASSCKVCEWQEATCFCSLTFISFSFHISLIIDGDGGRGRCAGGLGLVFCILGFDWTGDA